MSPATSENTVPICGRYTNSDTYLGLWYVTKAAQQSDADTMIRT